MRILLVEDDDTIAEPLCDGLGRYGFSVEHVRTGAAALDRREVDRQVDLVLLDLGLPDIDGIDVCRQLRSASPVPIIMLTARGAETDRVVGLELGADDYVAKPFSLRELVARIRAVTRRTQPPASVSVSGPAPAGGSPEDATTVRAGDLVIDRRTRRVRLAGADLVLAPKEFDLLALLATDPGAVFTRTQLLHAVWDEPFYGSTKTLDFHVAALRRKLDDPGWVQTVRGVGFRLAAPGEVAYSAANRRDTPTGQASGPRPPTG